MSSIGEVLSDSAALNDGYPHRLSIVSGVRARRRSMAASVPVVCRQLLWPAPHADIYRVGSGDTPAPAKGSEFGARVVPAERVVRSGVRLHCKGTCHIHA